jgi:DNA-binding NarL/FixJ family response regulator
VEAVRADHIDTVIIDAGLSDAQAIATARTMRAFRPQVKIILLSSQVTRVQQEAAQKAGVSAYLMKHRLVEELLPVLDRLLTA